MKTANQLRLFAATAAITSILASALSTSADHGNFLYGVYNLAGDSVFHDSVANLGMNVVHDGVDTEGELNSLKNADLRIINCLSDNKAHQYGKANYYRFEAEYDSGNGVITTLPVTHEGDSLGQIDYRSECSNGAAWYLDPDNDTAGLAVLVKGLCPEGKGREYNVKCRLRGIPDESSDTLANLKFRIVYWRTLDTIVDTMGDTTIDTLNPAIHDYIVEESMTITQDSISDSSFQEFVLGYTAPNNCKYCCSRQIAVEWPGHHELWVDYIEFGDDDGYNLFNGVATEELYTYSDYASFYGDPSVVALITAEELWSTTQLYPAVTTDTILKNADWQYPDSSWTCRGFAEFNHLYATSHSQGFGAAFGRTAQPDWMSTIFYPFNGWFPIIRKIDFSGNLSAGERFDTTYLIEPLTECALGDTNICLQEQLTPMAEGMEVWKRFCDSIGCIFIPILQGYSDERRLLPDNCTDDTSWYWHMRTPSAGETRCQANMALAYGANGILYYKWTGQYVDKGTAYIHHCGGTIDTIPNYEYRRTRNLRDSVFADARQALKDWVGPLIDSLGELFYRANWIDAGLADGNSISSIEGSFIDSVVSDSFPDEPYIEAAFFTDPEDPEADLFFLVNRRCLESETQTVHVWLENGEFLIVDMYSRDTTRVGSGFCSFADHLTTSLEPGQGKLFKVEPGGTAHPFVDSLEALTHGELFVTDSAYQNCESAERFFVLKNDDEELPQKVRVSLDVDSLNYASPVDMFYIIDQGTYDSAITGPLAGSSVFTLTANVPPESNRLFKVVPIGLTDGLPDSLLPGHWEGRVKVAGKVVGDGEAITIYPPAVIELSSDARIEVDGTLNAIGTENQKIKFVSANATPEEGDWDWIKIVGGGEATFEYCEFKHAYKGVWAIAHTTDSTHYDDSLLSVSIDQCLFDSIQVCGIEFWTVPVCTLEVMNSEIRDCGTYGVRVIAGLPTIKHNVFGPTGNSLMYACLIGGDGSYVTGGIVDNNLFDDISSGWALFGYMLNHSAFDTNGVFMARFNEINVDNSCDIEGAIQVYNCNDSVQLDRNQIYNDASGGGDYYGYGILNFTSPTVITGDIGAPQDSSEIRRWLYGLACFGSQSHDPDYPTVREISFKDNRYSVWVQDVSNCNLGTSFADPGNNYLHGYHRVTALWTVYNNSSDTVRAVRNYWDVDPSAWPLTYGNVDYSLALPANPFVGGGPMQRKVAVEMPKYARLEQNYPNPCNLGTQIRFALPEPRRVTISLYNILGQRIRRIVDGELAAGIHDVYWDGKDTRGGPVATGIYFYRIEAGDFVETKKMIVVK